MENKYRGLILMKKYEYWNKFIETGAISDYLNYTACTREQFQVKKSVFQKEDKISKKCAELKEGDSRGCSSNRYGDGINDHANW